MFAPFDNVGHLPDILCDPRVDIHRRSNIGMAQQFLLDLEINA